MKATHEKGSTQKKQKVIEKISSLGVKKSNSYDATPLFRLLFKNEKKGIRTEEVEDQDVA